MSDPVTLLRPYCTLSEVQGIAGVDDAEMDDVLKEAINRASRMVEDFTGRDFWFHDHTSDAYTVPRKRVIGPLALLPFGVLTLTEVLLDGASVDLADVYAEEGSLCVEYTADWGAYPFAGTLQLKGTFGFALVEGAGADSTPPPSLPASVSRATALIAATVSNEWRKEHVSPDGVRESLLQMRIPAEARDLLKQFDIRRRLATF